MLFENNSAHLSDFIRLNEEWIETYFSLEAHDRELAANPGGVIDAGGYIFTLAVDDHVIGACALFKETEGVFEIARMAVSPAQQGKGYGHELMQACLAKLRALNAKKAYIVSHTKLESAVSLYKKYDFETVHLGKHPVYARANIVLERHAF